MLVQLILQPTHFNQTIPNLLILNLRLNSHPICNVSHTKTKTKTPLNCNSGFFISPVKENLSIAVVKSALTLRCKLTYETQWASFILLAAESMPLSGLWIYIV